MATPTKHDKNLEAIQNFLFGFDLHGGGTNVNNLANAFGVWKGTPLQQDTGTTQQVFDILSKRSDFQSRQAQGLKSMDSGAWAQGGKDLFGILSGIAGVRKEKLTMNPRAFARLLEAEKLTADRKAGLAAPAETREQMLVRLARQAKANTLAQEAGKTMPFMSEWDKKNQNVTPNPGGVAGPQSDFSVSTSGAPIPQAAFNRAVDPNIRTRPEIAAMGGVQPAGGVKPPPAQVNALTNGSTPSPNGSQVNAGVPNNGSNLASNTSGGANMGNQSSSTLSDLQQAVLNAGQTGQQEQDTQKKLDDMAAQVAQIQASLGIAQADAEGQPIAMPFITGQQAQMERVAGARAGAVSAQQIPLQQQLARLQAQRTAEKAEATARLGFADKAADRTFREKQLAQQQSQFEASQAESQRQFDANALADAGTTSKEAKAEAQDLENQVSKAVDITTLIADLAAEPLLHNYIGPVAGRTPDMTAGAQDFSAKVNRLKNLLTLDNMKLMKGVLSDADIAILRSAGTELKQTGSEEAFIGELSRINKQIVDKLQEKGVKPKTYLQLKSFGTDAEKADARSFFAEIGLKGDTATVADLEEAYEILLSSQASGEVGFNTEGDTSVKTTGLQLGAITAYGSPFWGHGLDIDLAIGDPVPAFNSGKVVFAGNNGGFGNQVVIKTAKGNLIKLSHLDSIGVTVGDSVSQGQVVGKGGNTGKTTPGKGGDGSHLDLTVQKQDGSYYTPREIAQGYNLS